jgi:hypothetical protein
MLCKGLCPHFLLQPSLQVRDRSASLILLNGEESEAWRSFGSFQGPTV